MVCDAGIISQIHCGTLYQLPRFKYNFPCSALEESFVKHAFMPDCVSDISSTLLFLLDTCFLSYIHPETSTCS